MSYFVILFFPTSFPLWKDIIEQGNQLTIIIINFFFSFKLARVIPGSIPIWTKGFADNQSNSGAHLTVPPDALHVTEEDIYAPSIMVSGCYRPLAIQLGNNCNINSKFREKKCSIIRKDKISVRSFCNRSETANQIFEFQTLSFNIIINDEFINGQDNISVSFTQYAGHGATYNYNVSGYICLFLT